MEIALICEFSSDNDFETIEQTLRDLMKQEGFGVLTEIDVQAVMKEKLDLDKLPYKILGFCNPPRANTVLEADGDMGLFLPCNGVIYNTGDTIKISLTNADEMFKLVNNEEVAPIASEVTQIFEKVKKKLEEQFR